MNSPLLTQVVDQINPKHSTDGLESGQVLFFPDHTFSSIEPSVMTSEILDGKHKNISYHVKTKQLGGYNKRFNGLEDKLNPMMQAYAEFAFDLIQKTLPYYVPHLQWGRTSFRPAQITQRTLSKRKDDRRLHVDSFPATPVNGLRLLRVFCNVNPYGEPRVWHVGEPFKSVVKRFAPAISPYSPFKARVLKLLKATKSLRSSYDHYMLQLHDKMKLDDAYQATVKKTTIDFPAQSTWIVFTDQVSHAALSGQFLLEQTFYLPVEHMVDTKTSPRYQLNALIESA